MLMIDSREPEWVKESFPAFLEYHHIPITVEVKELPVGDFQYGNLIIERKEINDFYSSIVEQRMTLQKMKMVMAIEQGFTPYVLIHGSIDNVYMNALSKRSYCGMIASLNEYGVHTLHLEHNDITMLYEMIYALIRKHDEDKVLKLPFIEPRGDTWCHRSLQCIDGIGEETANRITKEFPTIHSMLDCSYDTLVEGLMEIEGIGRKTATHIADVVGESWR